MCSLSCRYNWNLSCYPYIASGKEHSEQPTVVIKALEKTW